MRYSLSLLATLLVFIITPASALAGTKPALSETLTAGPYTIVVNLFQNPPQVEQPLDLSIVSHDNLRLSGWALAQPGPGTDAVPVRTQLVEQAPGTLVGSMHLPVRGAWHLVFNLTGPRGSGSTGLDITVAAPNAISPWLGWLIGLSPLVGCAWLIWHQRRYRRKLLAEKSNT